MLSLLLTPFKWLLLLVGAIAIYMYFVFTTPVTKANERWQTKPACAVAIKVAQYSYPNVKLTNGVWEACGCLITALERGLGEPSAVRALEMIRQAALAKVMSQPRPRIAEEDEMKRRFSSMPSAKACLA